MSRSARRPRPSRGRGCGDARNAIRNTKCSTITIRYPFHPLCGQELAVERLSAKGDGFADCVDLEGRRLRVPLWMTSPEAAEHRLADAVRIDPKALLRLIDWVRCVEEIR